MHVICEAASLRDADLARTAAIFNSFAFHDPKEIPDVEQPNAEMTASQMEADTAAVRGWMMAMAGKAENG